jgi:hypothetical protein
VLGSPAIVRLRQRSAITATSPPPSGL